MQKYSFAIYLAKNYYLASCYIFANLFEIETRQPYSTSNNMTLNASNLTIKIVNHLKNYIVKIVERSQIKPPEVYF